MAHEGKNQTTRNKKNLHRQNKAYRSYVTTVTDFTRDDQLVKNSNKLDHCGQLHERSVHQKVWCHQTFMAAFYSRYLHRIYYY